MHKTELCALSHASLIRIKMSFGLKYLGLVSALHPHVT